MKHCYCCLRNFVLIFVMFIISALSAFVLPFEKKYSPKKLRYTKFALSTYIFLNGISLLREGTTSLVPQSEQV